VDKQYLDMNDSQLIEQIRSGNTGAFNHLVTRWEKPIHRFAFRYIADNDDAADITQKTFIKAYQSLDSLQDTDKFSSWIYRIASNLCIDETRRNGKLKISPLESWIESSEVAAVNTPETKLEKNELGKLMQKALLAIPDDQRTVIILKEYEGLKFREIAHILQESENTVKSRMYYGLNALRKVFKKWNIEKEALYYE
jgi:RNA polymerase sigma-70 factor (ECF subfamily)